MADHKDNDPENDDKHLFRDAIKGTRRLKTNNKVKPYRERIKPVPVQSLKDEKHVILETLESSPSDACLELEQEQGDELIYSRPGVQQSVMKKLRRGQLSIEAELDLHRLTSEQAHAELMDFIVRCQRQHIRCVRIIHGKGLSSKNQIPVLKIKVNKWLRQWDNVLAFCSARPVDGGTGAVYILLKRM